MRKLSWRWLALALSCSAAGYLAAHAMTPARVTVDARKFEFSPKEFRAKKGQPVIFVLSSPDFVHGFSIPDFNARIDIVPGRTVELTLTPDRTGKFPVLCDNFCGEGHEKMTGYLVVTE